MKTKPEDNGFIVCIDLVIEKTVANRTIKNGSLVVGIQSKWATENLIEW